TAREIFASQYHTSSNRGAVVAPFAMPAFAGKEMRLAIQLPVAPIQDRLAPFPRPARRMKPCGANRVFPAPSLSRHPGDRLRSGENSAGRPQPVYGLNEHQDPSHLPRTHATRFSYPLEQTPPPQIRALIEPRR